MSVHKYAASGQSCSARCHLDREGAKASAVGIQASLETDRCVEQACMVTRRYATLIRQLNHNHAIRLTAWTLSRIAAFVLRSHRVSVEQGIVDHTFLSPTELLLIDGNASNNNFSCRLGWFCLRWRLFLLSIKRSFGIEKFKGHTKVFLGLGSGSFNLTASYPRTKVSALRQGNLRV